MRLHRFYTEENLASKDSCVIGDKELLHQLRDVFRLGTGDKIILFSGDGFDYTYTITESSKKEIELKKEDRVKNFIPKRKVTLLLSLIKKDNFELVLEKATELGVTHFVPVISERTLLKNLNFERAKKILKEASEQCGRGDVPTISVASTLEEVLKNYPELIAFNMNGIALQPNQLTNLQPSLLIGPEGGWSEKETELFKEKKIKIYKLGDTVLRAETAAILASGIICINWE